jgi:hypothetical protein
MVNSMAGRSILTTLADLFDYCIKLTLAVTATNDKTCHYLLNGINCITRNWQAVLSQTLAALTSSSPASVSSYVNPFSPLL